MSSEIILGLILIIFVLISIILDKNKEIEKYRKDWEFSKSLKKEKEQ